jgi:hypothetical protein
MSTAWTSCARPAPDLRQIYAVRKAIEKLETLILEKHLHGCVPEGIKEGRESQVIEELVQLFGLAGNREQLNYPAFGAARKLPFMAQIHSQIEVAEATAAPKTTRVTLAIEGMTRASCAMRIEKGLKFHRAAWRSARHVAVSMDTLVSLGAIAAFLMSVVATSWPQIVGAVTLYDTTALIITLIYLGEYLEARERSGQRRDPQVRRAARQRRPCRARGARGGPAH